MTKYTLDTNCLITIEEGRPDAASVRTLASAHSLGTTNVAVVAISASENPRIGRFFQNFGEFQTHLADLGHLEILRPMAYWDVAFWDWCVWADQSMAALERKIHEILFPGVEFLWEDYCISNKVASNVIDKKWRNCKCDVQAMWSHLHNNRDVFITGDGNFHKASKKAALISLGAKRIEYPLVASQI